MLPTLQKAVDYAQNIKREFILVEGIQQTELCTIMLIDLTGGNDPMRQQRVAAITC